MLFRGHPNLLPDVWIDWLSLRINVPEHTNEDTLHHRFGLRAVVTEQQYPTRSAKLTEPQTVVATFLGVEKLQPLVSRYHGIMVSW